MKLYSANDNYKLYQGNMLDMLEVIEANSIDSIVTDPPYELNFMGKGWDNAGVSFQKETWKQCYEVLKPGGYLLAFGGSRTFHRIACAIEDAGFEIRDTIMWLYGSGFPKSMNIGLAIDKKNGVKSKIIGERKQTGAKFKLTQELIDNGGFNDPNRESFTIKEAQNKWKGWGSALKPSYEPIIVARKPFKGSLVDNVIKYGVGGINIDECRVAFNGDKWKNQKSGSTAKAFNLNEQQRKAGTGVLAGYECKANEQGRFPANTILTYDETDFDEVCGRFPNTKGEIGRAGRKNGGNYNASSYKVGVATDYGFKDEGSASRYFYCAKASKKDRDEGLENFDEQETKVTNQYGMPREDGSIREVPFKKNIHPTVKPTNLMQYLVRLATPKGAIILDPFMGSGSTGKAVMYENKERNKNYKFIGIELEPEYLNISKARLDFVIKK